MSASKTNNVNIRRLMNSYCNEAKSSRIFIDFKVILNVTFKKYVSKHNTSTAIKQNSILKRSILCNLGSSC